MGVLSFGNQNQTEDDLLPHNILHLEVLIDDQSMITIDSIVIIINLVSLPLELLIKDNPM